MQTVASSLGFVSVSVWCGILDWASALMTKGKKKEKNTYRIHGMFTDYLAICAGL